MISFYCRAAAAEAMALEMGKPIVLGVIRE
jgi:hypothetical protein